jgi:hypothetical protein
MAVGFDWSLILSCLNSLAMLHLVQDEKWLKKCERIFQFSLNTVTALAKEAPIVALRLFLQGALTADQVGNETITYEFISQVRERRQGREGKGEKGRRVEKCTTELCWWDVTNHHSPSGIQSVRRGGE